MASTYVGTTFMPPLFGQITSYFGFYMFSLLIGGILILNIVMVELMIKRLDKKGVLQWN